MTIDEKFWKLIREGYSYEQARVRSRDDACLICKLAFDGPRYLAAHNIREHR